MTGGATAGAGREFRLDPGTLPVCSETAEGGRADFFLDHDVVVFRSAAGTRQRTVPVSDYEGVAVRIAPVIGPLRLALELSHPDPDYVLPLACGGQPDDVAADWQAWGRKLGLPLLVVSPDGSVTRYERHGPAGKPTVALNAPVSRRRHAYFAGRRPRFLKRRKAGPLGGLERIVAREIIART